MIFNSQHKHNIHEARIFLKIIHDTYRNFQCVDNTVQINTLHCASHLYGYSCNEIDICRQYSTRFNIKYVHNSEITKRIILVTANKIAYDKKDQVIIQYK